MIAWSKTLTILSPWRRGKADTVVDGEVVLTKVKVLSRSQRNLLSPVAEPAASPDQNQAADAMPDRETEAMGSGAWGRTEDSEDSGLDSPSSPLRSNNSLVHNSLVHSRGSSCDSGNSDQTELLSQDQEEAQCYQSTIVTRVFPDEAVFAKVATELTDGRENSQDSEKSQLHISEGTEEFMEECCRLQAQSLSGLGYLDQVCRLVERISRLQDLVLHLQRELRSQRRSQKLDPSLDPHKLVFLMQHCTCGAADRLLSPVQTQNQTMSLSRTHPKQDLSQDLRSIPESPPQLYSCRDSAPCRKRRSRRSLTDGSSTWSGNLRREVTPFSRSL